jgi:hypothetical protein
MPAILSKKKNFPMNGVLVAVNQQLIMLKEALAKMPPNDYSRHSVYLSGATIGQHGRHIIELWQCLLKGYSSGGVNYDDRPRNRLMEEDAGCALAALDEISCTIELTDKPLILEVSLHHRDHQPVAIHTSFHRELAYNLDHTIHHMALIRVAMQEFGIAVGNDIFGVAYATAKFRETCAQ